MYLFGRAKTGGLGQVTTKKNPGITRPRPHGGVKKTQTGIIRPRPDGGVMKKKRVSLDPVLTAG